jgi:hypothetical protein
MRGDASVVLGAAPRLVLAMALYRDGRVPEARTTLAAAILSHDWRYSQVRDQDSWICQVFRRDAEAMIIQSLPAFLDGKYRPQDNDERLALLGVCQFTNRARASARLYADGFATDPYLAENLRATRVERSDCFDRPSAYPRWTPGQFRARRACRRSARGQSGATWP